MPKPIITGKGNEHILISSDQSWFVPWCWLPPLPKEQMLRKEQSSGSIREGKIVIAVFRDGPGLLEQGGEWVISRFIMEFGFGKSRF